MHRPRRKAAIWRTAAFRLALVFAAIFGAGVAILLVLLDVGIARYAEAELRSALRHQMGIMRADAHLEGGDALVNILAEHVRTDTISRYRYLVILASGSRFESGVPMTAVDIDGFGVVSVVASDGAAMGRRSTVDVLVYTERLADGTFMAVGREVYPLDDLRLGLNRIALLGSIALIILAGVAGLVAGLLFLRRLESVNATTGRIMQGVLSERLPNIGFGQEFDDLTYNLNAMLDRLEALMVAMRQISTDLAHDLRMPLTRLRNQLEQIETRDASQAQQVSEAIAEADEILKLFSAMLRLARLESGASHHAMAAVDLGGLLDDAIGAFLPAAEDQGRQLMRRGASTAALVMGDEALLAQMLANLIDNAICHTRPGAVITCQVLATSDEVVLSIEDNGPGAPREEIPHLTRRFYRLDRSRHQPGTGLGLSLVAAITDLHGGRMVISDLNPGLSVSVRFRSVEA